MFDKYLIDELRALEREATPGPWKLSVDTWGDSYIDSLKIQSPWIEDAWGGDDEANANMKLISAMRNALPGLLDEIASLITEVEMLRESAVGARRGQWIPITNGRDGHECSGCHGYAPSFQVGSEYLSPYCPVCGAKMDAQEDML